MIKTKEVPLSNGEVYIVKELTTKDLLNIVRRGEALGRDLVNGLILGEWEDVIEVLALQDGSTKDEILERIPTASDLAKIVEAIKEVNDSFFRIHLQKLRNFIQFEDLIGKLIQEKE